MRLTLLLCLLTAPALAANMNARPAADPYLCLEDVNSPRALDWVRQQDAASRAVLEADKHYKPFFRCGPGDWPGQRPRTDAEPVG